MKICLCTTRLKSDLTEAISKNFYNLSEELTKQGHDVTILSPVKIDFPLKSKLIVYSNPHSYESKFMGLKNLLKLKKIINNSQDNYDVFHIHSGFLLEAFLLRNIKPKKPIFITIWQPYLDIKEFFKTFYFSIKSPKNYLYHFTLNSFLAAPFLKLGVKKTFTKIIVSSNYQKKQLIKHFPEQKIEIIPNGLTDSKEKLKIEVKNAPRILYIGHFTPFKGADSLLKAVYYTKEKFPDTILTLAWSGYGSKNKIQKLIKKLDLTNNIIPKDKIDVYKELVNNDFLIIPYKSTIGTSHYHNVLLEAMSTGTLVLASNIGSIPEIIKDKETGIFIDPNNPKQIAETIVNTFTNEELRKKISKNSISLFREKFLIENVAKKHLELYNEARKG